MAKIRCGKPESIPRRGFSTFVNALAFSTLLSSQETDAHLVLNFRSPLGATLLIYRVFLSCQIGVSADLTFRNFPVPSLYRPIWSGAARARNLRGDFLLVAPRVQERR